MHQSFRIPLYLLAMKSHFVREIFLWFYKLCTPTQILIWETIINVKKIGEHIYTVLDWNSPLLLLAINLRFYSFIFQDFKIVAWLHKFQRHFLLFIPVPAFISYPSNYRDSVKAFWEGFLMKSCQICMFAQLDKVFVVQFAYSYSSHLYRGRSRLFCN